MTYPWENFDDRDDAEIKLETAFTIMPQICKIVSSRTIVHVFSFLFGGGGGECAIICKGLLRFIWFSGKFGWMEELRRIFTTDFCLRVQVVALSLSVRIRIVGKYVYFTARWILHEKFIWGNERFFGIRLNELYADDWTEVNFRVEYERNNKYYDYYDFYVHIRL